MPDSQKHYTFTAFISYRRGGEDEAIARWIQKKLESYRIPTDIAGSSLERKNPKAKERFKIFRDKTDLGSHANLDSGLAKSLEQCRFLILIASPRSAESSYVNDEVRHFQDTGRGTNIIPLIISGTPAPGNTGEKQCYPPALGPEALGVTLAEGSREEALIKVVARLLQVDFSRLYQRHLRLQRRFMFRALAAALCVLLLVSGLAVWALNAERRATAQRKEAEELVRFLTLDLSVDVYRHVPAKARKAISEKVDAYYGKWGPSDPRNMYLYAVNLYAMGVHVAGTGDLAGAQDLLLKALNAVRALRQSGAAQSGQQVVLLKLDAAEAECLGYLGAIALALNDFAPAEEYAKASIEAKRRYLAANPDKPEAKFSLAAGLETLRLVAVEKKDLHAAAGVLDETIALMRELTAAHPENADSLPVCEEAVNLTRVLAENDPFNMMNAARHVHAVLLLSRGYFAENALDRLQKHVLASACTATFLLQKDPKSVSHRALLAVVKFYEGVTLVLQKDAESGQGLLRSTAASVAEMRAGMSEKTMEGALLEEIEKQFDAVQKTLEAGH